MLGDAVKLKSIVIGREPAQCHSFQVSCTLRKFIPCRHMALNAVEIIIIKSNFTASDVCTRCNCEEYHSVSFRGCVRFTKTHAIIPKAFRLRYSEKSYHHPQLKRNNTFPPRQKIPSLAANGSDSKSRNQNSTSSETDSVAYLLNILSIFEVRYDNKLTLKAFKNSFFALRNVSSAVGRVYILHENIVHSYTGIDPPPPFFDFRSVVRFS